MKKDRTETQCEKVLHYMQRFGSITPVEALDNIGCFRLAARIADLRGQGVQIKAERETHVNRLGDRATYTRYSLI